MLTRAINEGLGGILNGYGLMGYPPHSISKKLVDIKLNM
jgi:hypothetical protein